MSITTEETIERARAVDIDGHFIDAANLCEYATDEDVENATPTDEEWESAAESAINLIDDEFSEDAAVVDCALCAHRAAADREVEARGWELFDLRHEVIDAIEAELDDREVDYNTDKAGSGSAYIGLEDCNGRCIRVSDHVHGDDRNDQQGRTPFNILIGGEPNGLEAAHVTDSDQAAEVVRRAVDWLLAKVTA